MNGKLNETESSTPVNAIGASSSVAGSGNIDTYDPLLKIKNAKNKLKKFSVFKRNIK